MAGVAQASSIPSPVIVHLPKPGEHEQLNSTSTSTETSVARKPQSQCYISVLHDGDQYQVSMHPGATVQECNSYCESSLQRNKNGKDQLRRCEWLSAEEAEWRASQPSSPLQPMDAKSKSDD